MENEVMRVRLVIPAAKKEQGGKAGLSQQRKHDLRERIKGGA